MSARQTIHYSVIVPAYRENGNLRPLVTRIFAALRRVDSPVPAEQTEIIIVDDNSRDGSQETVQALQHEGYNVRIIVRTAERGLSSAVVRGFQEAAGDNMLCMDADLQVRNDLGGISVLLLNARHIAPARVRAGHAGRAFAFTHIRPGYPLRQGRGNGQGLASAPPHHLCRRTSHGPSLDDRKRPHVRVLRHPERICEPVSSRLSLTYAQAQHARSS